MTESVGEFFDSRARIYDASFDRRSADGYALRSRMAAVLRAVGPGPGQVLDAGMGPGRLCAELAQCGWTVSGVDASEEMIGIARARLPNARNRLLRGEIEKLPFADASFDAVTATGVLEYADVPSALGQLSSVLRRGGIAVISYPNSGAVYSLWKVWLYYPAVRLVKRALRMNNDIGRAGRSIDPDQFKTLLRAAGLEPIGREYTSFLPLVAPLDTLLPPIAARLGEFVERAYPALGPKVATQIVYVARKP
jgi:ubiquinone/menaquinone biosynthesis C-methylase UbiE